MPSKTYAKLLADSPELITCKYGRGDALGFRGTREQIDRAYALFSNYTAQASKHGPYEPKLKWIGDHLAFISTPLEAARAAIKTFLYVNILLAKEVEVADFYDEQTDQWMELRDDDKAEQMADADADAFMQTIKTESFVTE